MSEDKKYELKDEELDNIAGGVYPYELWTVMTTEERQTAQTDSILTGLLRLSDPCKLDEGFAWDEAELKGLYESHGLTFPGMENIDFSLK